MEHDSAGYLFFSLTHLPVFLCFYIQEQKYAEQINELEGHFYQKSKEIGMIQTELRTIKQFQKRKIQVEKELDDVSFFLLKRRLELTTMSAKAFTDIYSCKMVKGFFSFFYNKSVRHQFRAGYKRS